MNTTEQAQQLRLAAGIIETGHPWDLKVAEKWHSSSKYISAHPLSCIFRGQEIRLALATPPDGRPLHNPDNLTAEQVGAGYRLLTQDEFQKDAHPEHQEWWSVSFQPDTWVKEKTQRSRAHLVNYGTTYRVPLSVPWPEAPKPDPYAELKAAYKAGKVIQSRSPLTAMQWTDCSEEPEWGVNKGEELRVKPWSLPPPPPGMKWHREDGWKEGDLPQGYRPLALNEQIQKGDEIKWAMDCDWMAMDGLVSSPAGGKGEPKRTTRPLVFTHEGKEWTYHKPGDPMPCDGKIKVETLTVGGDLETSEANSFEWSNGPSQFDIIGWRYAEPETKTVPLGPEDVPPGSVLQKHGNGTYYTPLCVSTPNDGVYLHDAQPFKESYKALSEEWQINRSIPLTGKWDPTAWESCHKTIPAR